MSSAAPALGALVSAGRKRAKLSQRALGALLQTPHKPDGVWGTYIGQIEQGKRVPPDAMILLLAAALEIDAQRLLAAAYESRAHTPTAQKLFALAPFLLFLRKNQATATTPAATDAALSSLQRLATLKASVPDRRLVDLLAALGTLDERRWLMLHNAATAMCAVTSERGERQPPSS
jgi:transcriptional regulator with XRE-family HTH domain